MQWEHLTAIDFAKAVKESKSVAVVPVGVIEAHASHLPLGTDMLSSHWIACRAAEIEPVVVFPAYPYGIDHEAAHLPGAVVLKRELVFSLLENICDEIGRNGFEKIILLNGHGGNRFYLPLFIQTLVEKEKPYIAYYADLPRYPGESDLLDQEELGHACERETSSMLYIAAELVKMEQLPPKPFPSLSRNKELSEAGAYSPVDWYAMYPVMYVGDSSKATAEKGKVLVKHRINALVRLIRVVKEDKVTPKLHREFLKKQQKPSVPDEWK